MAKAEILRGELISKEVIIVDSTNPANIGLKGRIIDETKNTFVIRTPAGERKRIIKSQVVLRLKLDKESFDLEGRLLQKRPEERIKKTN